MGYALKTHGYRIWLPDEDKIIETINLKFDPESTLYRSRAVLGPDSTNNPESADNYYFLVENLPICSNLNSNDKSDINVNEPIFLMPDQDDQNLSNSVPDTPEPTSPPVSQLKHVTWHRYVVPRKTGNKVDVYYYPDGSNDRLRSLDNLTKYCQKHNIFLDPDLINFSSKISYQGIVKDKSDLLPNSKNNTQPSTSATQSDI